MADLSNLKIKNTYQLLLQADPSGNVQNLQGATPNPLIVNGNLRYVDGNQQADYYLKSDGAGNASWAQVIVSGDIYISAATMDDTVLKLHTTSGTTINVPVSYWSTDGNGNYSNSGLTGNVGIGTSSPNSKLTVVGAVSATTNIVADGTIYSGSSKLESLFLTQASLSGSSIVDKVGDITTNQFTVWSDSNKTLKSIPNLRLQGSTVTGDIISGTTLSASTMYTSGDISVGGTISAQTLYVSGDIGIDGNIVLDEDQRIYFEEDSGTWMEAVSENKFRIVVGGLQMFTLTEDYDGSADFASFGSNTNVGIQLGNNTYPAAELTVDGTVSATTDLRIDGAIYSGSSKLENLFLTQASLSGSSAVDKIGTITALQFAQWSDSDKTLKSISNLRVGGNGSPSQPVISGLISATTLSAATVYTSNNAFVGGYVTSTYYEIGDDRELFATLDDDKVILIGNSNSLNGIRLGRNSTDRIQIMGDTIATGIVSNSFISGSTLSAVTLNIQDTLTAGNTTVGSLVATTLDTGQGANELYDMDQNVKTDSAVTFTTVDTGQGANELYAMNQDVETTDAVTFVGITTNVLSGVTISATTVHASDVYGNTFYSNGYKVARQSTGILTFGDTDNQVQIDARTSGLLINGSITTLTNMSASGNISGATLQGIRKFTEPSITHNSYQGDIIYNPPGASEYEVTQGTVYCLTGSTWVSTDADIPNLSKGLLGIAVGVSNFDGFLIKGYYTLSIDVGTISNPLYLATTGGRVSDVAPSSTGQFVRIVGYAMDSLNGQIWFDPDKTWVELS